MQEQQEWLELLTHSSKYQPEQSLSAAKQETYLPGDKQQQINMQLQNGQNKQITNYAEELIFTQKCGDSINFISFAKMSKSQLSKIKQIDEENQMSEIEPFRYSKFVQIASQTQLEVGKLQKTIKGLTDQVLQYRKRISQLTTNLKQMEKESISQIHQSIYTNKLPKMQGNHLASQSLQIESLKKNLRISAQQNQNLKKQISRLLVINAQQQKQNQFHKSIYNKKQVEFQLEKLQFTKKIQQMIIKLQEKDKQCIEFQQQINNYLKRIVINKQCLSTSDEGSSDINCQGKTIKNLSSIQQQQQTIKQLRKMLQLKEQTINYTQKMLLKSQTERINAEIQKGIYQQQLCTNQIQQNFQGVALQNKECKNRITQLIEKIETLQQSLSKKKEKRMVPEMMSPQETIIFLIKTLGKVKKSANMKKVLGQNQQFKLFINQYNQKNFINK